MGIVVYTYKYIYSSSMHYYDLFIYWYFYISPRRPLEMPSLQILFRNYIFGRGANWKYPAPEILNSAAAATDVWFLLPTNISLIPKFKNRPHQRPNFELWILSATNVYLAEFRIWTSLAINIWFQTLDLAEASTGNTPHAKLLTSKLYMSLRRRLKVPNQI